MVDGESAVARAAARLPGLGVPLFKAFMVARFLAGRHTSVRLYYGARIGIDLWQMMLQRMFYFRFWEPNISSLVEETLRPGDVFVDLGAHAGYYSLLASRLVGPEGGVVSVEALPANYAMLQRNIARNGAANVRAVNCAVSDSAGELKLFRGAFRNTGTTTTDEASGGPLVAKVPARPLDEILTSQERARVAMIKVDVEGAEAQVLGRLLATLDGYPRRLQIVCEFDTGIGGDGLRRTFRDFLAAGFEAWRIPNDYSWDAYLRWKGPEPLAPLSDLPEGGCDVLLRRAATAPEEDSRRC